MTKQILIAGFGGQGILFSGKFLAYHGLLKGKEVSWLPSYGPEMRGGTANCSIIVSDVPVGSPIVSSSFIERKVARTDVEAYYIPATKLASDAGLTGLANMIMIGHMMKKSGLIAPEEVDDAMHKVVSAKKQALFDLNKKAVQLGYDYEG